MAVRGARRSRAGSGLPAAQAQRMADDYLIVTSATVVGSLSQLLRERADGVGEGRGHAMSAAKRILDVGGASRRCWS